MKPERQRALLELSVFTSPDPSAVMRRVLEIAAAEYGGTMVMINLIDGCRIGYRDIVNPHPLFRIKNNVELSHSYCQFATGAVRPLLIQNAAEEDRFRGHPALRFGFTRYLGVPILDTAATAVGTLCFVDNRSHEPLGQEDVEFFTVLAMRVSAELERERLIERRVAEERAAAERLAELNDRLLRAAEEKRRLVSAVVHDLSQPIAAMRTTLYLLRGQEDPAEREECLDLLDNRVAALHGLVDELLEYARIEAGEVPWHCETVDLERVLRSCAEEFRADAARRGVEIALDLGRRLGTMETDPARLCHVVRNLISNGVKYAAPPLSEHGHPSRPHATVRIRARSDGAPAWRLEVSDNGRGMDPEVLTRAFEEFYQGPGAPMAALDAGLPRGRGLGLSVVKHLCAAMGGQISVRSQPGRGSSFTIRFPRVVSCEL